MTCHLSIKRSELPTKYGRRVLFLTMVKNIFFLHTLEITKIVMSSNLKVSEGRKSSNISSLKPRPSYIEETL